MTLDAADQRLVDGVAEHGWWCIHIHDSDPVFSFSVGFWETLGAPEIIIFGLRSEVMHRVLWEMFRRIKDGEKLTDGARWSGLIEGFDCISRPVHSTEIPDHLGTAMWYRRYQTGSSAIDAFQLFWPGKIDGLFRWEPGCHEAVRAAQPALYLPRQRPILRPGEP